jgi:hypothetical protein
MFNNNCFKDISLILYGDLSYYSQRKNFENQEDFTYQNLLNLNNSFNKF